MGEFLCGVKLPLNHKRRVTPAFFIARGQAHAGKG